MPNIMKEQKSYRSKTYNTLNISKKSSKIILLFFILTSTTFNLLYSTNFYSSNIDNKRINNIEQDILKVSQFGEDPWWHASWKYRQCINITNPYNLDLINYMVSIKINHTELLQKNHIRSDLGDIRIIEKIPPCRNNS